MSFRFDRFVTLYLVNPLGRGASGNKPSIPILMYHSIGDEDETGVQPYYRTATTPSVFALHMKHLADHGYSTINVADAVKFLQNGSATKKYAVITFDDGDSNFLAAPPTSCPRSATISQPLCFYPRRTSGPSRSSSKEKIA